MSAAAAAVVFTPEETVVNDLTRWWRVRAPCPLCSEQMTLRGFGDALFQGCDAHGFFVDQDTVGNTGLARPGLRDRLTKMREDADRHRAELARREEAERKADEERAAAVAKEKAAAKARREELKRAQGHEQRAKLVTRINAALATGNGEHIADEILRLEQMINALANRLTDAEQDIEQFEND